MSAMQIRSFPPHIGKNADLVLTCFVLYIAWWTYPAMIDPSKNGSCPQNGQVPCLDQ